jgi:hypothetical protein
MASILRGNGSGVSNAGILLDKTAYIQSLEMGFQMLSAFTNLLTIRERNVLAQLDLHECQFRLGHFIRLPLRDQLSKLKPLRICFPGLMTITLTFLVHFTAPGS